MLGSINLDTLTSILSFLTPNVLLTKIALVNITCFEIVLNKKWASEIESKHSMVDDNEDTTVLEHDAPPFEYYHNYVWRHASRSILDFPSLKEAQYVESEILKRMNKSWIWLVKYLYTEIIPVKVYTHDLIYKEIMNEICSLLRRNTHPSERNSSETRNTTETYTTSKESNHIAITNESINQNSNELLRDESLINDRETPIENEEFMQMDDNSMTNERDSIDESDEETESDIELEDESEIVEEASKSKILHLRAIDAIRRKRIVQEQYCISIDLGPQSKIEELIRSSIPEGKDSESNDAAINQVYRVAILNDDHTDIHKVVRVVRNSTKLNIIASLKRVFEAHEKGYSIVFEAKSLQACQEVANEIQRTGINAIVVPMNPPLIENLYRLTLRHPEDHPSPVAWIQRSNIIGSLVILGIGGKTIPTITEDILDMFEISTSLAERLAVNIFHARFYAIANGSLHANLPVYEELVGKGYDVLFYRAINDGL